MEQRDIGIPVPSALGKVNRASHINVDGIGFVCVFTAAVSCHDGERLGAITGHLLYNIYAVPIIA